MTGEPAMKVEEGPDEVPALRIVGLSKTFPGQRALDQVSLEVGRGEVHALVGENGSGKSTLIKCLAGVYEPDSGGVIEVGGRSVDLPLTPSSAVASGLAFVHQDLGLVPTLSVLENMSLSRGFLTGPGGNIRWKSEARRARAALAELGVDIDPRRSVSTLPVAERTLVAIARALRGSEDARILVLDEPTAALPQHEVERLFEAIREMARRGVGIIYVSHRLPEVFALADRTTVLRDGKVVGRFERDELKEEELVSAIIGRSLASYYPEAKGAPSGKVVCRAAGHSGSQVQDLDLTLRAGEIVGVAGLLGSGRSELARLIAGAQDVSAGTVEIDGERLAGGSTRKAIASGVVFVPEDRRGSAAFPTQTLQENLTLPAVREMTRFGRIDRRKERQVVTGLIERFNVNPGDPKKRFSFFSGGNQQKAILARWISLGPRVIVLDEPVQGVDVGSRSEVYEHIRRAADEGAAVLLIDSELEDLARLSDRIVVMARGRIVDELSGAVARDDIAESIFKNEGALT